MLMGEQFSYRYDIINHLIKLRGYKRYLEVGVNDGSCFTKIECKHKDAVDPGAEGGESELINYPITSDEFFHNVAPYTLPYDIIFVDGLHTKEQVDKDIRNSLKNLNFNGALVLHDTHPWHEHETRPYEQFLAEGRDNTERGWWVGTTWQSVVRLRSENPFVKVKTVMIREHVDDADVSILEPTCERQPLLEKHKEMYNYSYFAENKQNLLNLISAKDFFSLYDK